MSALNKFEGAYRRRAGFGFMEVMVSLVLLVVLGAVVMRFVADVETEDERDLRKAREGVMLLKSALGAYSFDLAKPAPDDADGGLQVLVDTGYLKAIPTDPWGQAYQYRKPGQYGGRVFDLYSLGPDGKESEDDIADWNLYGKAYYGTSRIARKRDHALQKYSAGDPKS